MQYFDYCHQWREGGALQVRAHAEKLGIEVEIGMRSICPVDAGLKDQQFRRF